MNKVVSIIAIIISALVAILLIASAYGGIINPMSTTIPALMTMIFPIVLPLSVVLTVAFLFIRHLASALLICALLVCLPAIYTYYPLEISKSEHEPDFTLMSYNVAHLKDFTSKGATPPENPTLKFILSQSPDIVALQECSTFSKTVKDSISQSLLDSLFSVYPNHKNGIEGQAILSKHPFQEVKLHRPTNQGFQVRAYRIIMPTDSFTLFNVHLKSIGLNNDDKTLYKDLTNGITESENLKDEISEIRRSLISKLSESFRVRAQQSQLIKELIDSIGGKIIVCGDFNDVPGCYAIRTIESAGLKDAYAKSAFGASITFHMDRFYFRIDHILYRGFTPLKTKCLSVPYSDHYPLVTSFKTEK